MDGDDSDKYITSARIRKTFGVSNTTLRNWAEAGRVRTVRVGTNKEGHRLYLRDDIIREFPGYHPRGEASKAAAAAANSRTKYCYARVSSGKQKDDLERQVAALKEEFPDHEVVTDIGSGLNWKRPNFLRILDGAVQGTVSEVVVAHRDRLCRFAFELVEHILKKGGCKLVVLHASDDSAPGGESGDGTAELKDDLLAIVTCFVASNNGKRAAAHRRAARDRKAKAKESSDESSESEEDQATRSGKGTRGVRAPGPALGPDEVPEAMDLPDGNPEADN